MIIRIQVALCAAAVLALMGSPAQAHHSAAAYDTSKTTSVTGVVSRLQWRNPHVIIRLEVEDEDGNKAQWALETAGIQKLISDGSEMF